MTNMGVKREARRNRPSRRLEGLKRKISSLGQEEEKHPMFIKSIVRLAAAL